MTSTTVSWTEMTSVGWVFLIGPVYDDSDWTIVGYDLETLNKVRDCGVVIPPYVEASIRMKSAERQVRDIEFKRLITDDSMYDFDDD